MKRGALHPTELPKLASLLVLLACLQPEANADPYIYSKDFDGYVSVIDVASETEVTTIETGSGGGFVTIEPDAHLAFVSNQGGSSISVIDLAANAVSNTIPVGETPWKFELSPDGSFAYLTLDSASVNVIDLESQTVSGVIDVGSQPFGVGFLPGADLAYVCNAGDDSISVIDTDTHSVLHSFPVTGGPAEVVFSPSGERAYVANVYSTVVTVLDVGSESVITTVEVGPDPTDLAISKDGDLLYVAVFGGDFPDFEGGGLAIVDTTTNELEDFIDQPGTYQVVLDDAGARIYTSVANFGVTVIDNATATIIGEIPTNIPQGLALIDIPLVKAGFESK